MKKLVFLLIAAASIATPAMSQQDKDKKGKVGEAVNKAGNETAHVAVAGASNITDKRYKGKYGPKGQEIFINKHSRYYYVDERGKKIYLKKSQLRNKK
jgi:hypothetical protein